jgi:dTDP-4-dehydrorhamnose 3,5-epimerase
MNAASLTITPLPISGAYLIVPARHTDHRGYFFRTYCEREFASAGLETNWVQCNVSYNSKAGTLRGLHFQCEPNSEIKLVRCTRGKVFDVIVDIRHDSPTYRQWHAVTLSENNCHSIYIPAGCAHGFQTLHDGTELFYQMSSYYVAELARGIRWDDPTINIAWPQTEQRIIHDRDLNWPEVDE